MTVLVSITATVIALFMSGMVVVGYTRGRIG